MQLRRIKQTLSNGQTISGLRTVTRDLPLVVFLHGNGLAAGVYMPMLELIAPHYDLLMFDIPGHGESDPAGPDVGWNETADLVWQAMLQTGLTRDRDVYGVAHSLGGAFSLLSSHRHPGVFKSLVLLDPIIFPRRLLLFMRVISFLRLTARFHPHVSSTLRRRRHWQDRQAAYEYFHGRKIYRDWTDAAVKSYIDYALKDESEGGVALCCTPETEARYFASLPRGMWDALKNINIETKIVMGESSYPFSYKAAITAQTKNNYIRCTTVPGTHCFMQEYPEAAATLVLSVLAEPQESGC